MPVVIIDDDAFSADGVLAVRARFADESTTAAPKSEANAGTLGHIALISSRMGVLACLENLRCSPWPVSLRQPA